VEMLLLYKVIHGKWARDNDIGQDTQGIAIVGTCQMEKDDINNTIQGVVAGLDPK
jgi:hypothetical protein